MTPRDGSDVRGEPRSKRLASTTLVLVMALVLALSVAAPVTAVGTDDERAATAAANASAVTTGGSTVGGDWTDPERVDEAVTQAGQVGERKREAAESGVDEAVDVLQRQGVSINQTQRAAAVNGSIDAATQHQDATVEQVQNASYGAATGTFLQSQNVSVEQVQNATLGGASGALSQRQNATATQMQHAAFGATHGAVAQQQNATVEQVQVVARGAASGAAHEAGKKSDDETAKKAHPGAVREAAQGAAFGALVQKQEVSVEQRQYAAVGAAEGALAQNQSASVKQIQVAAIGAAEGALTLRQRQEVTVKQVQAAARGACKGAIKQSQRVSVTQIQEAALGAARGAVSQSQEATVEQVQAAASGGAKGSLVQRQVVSVTQVQYAAAGGAKGALSSAVQHQTVRIELIQSAAQGASAGAVTQVQTIDVVQIQSIATSGARGALDSVTQVQNVQITQVQNAALGATRAGLRQTQTIRISIEQVQRIVQQSATETVVFVVENEVADESEIAERSSESVDEEVGTTEPEPQPNATVTFEEQRTTGDSVLVRSASLERGGFLAVYEGGAWAAGDADPLGVSEYLPEGEQTNVSVALDEELERNATLVVVAYRDTDDDQSFDFATTDGETDYPYRHDDLETVRDGAEVVVAADGDEPDEPEPPANATLSVSDQSGNGTVLVVADADATVPYVVEADYDAGTTTTEEYAAGESQTNETLALDPPVADDGPVAVTVRDAETGDALANETIEYDVEPVGNVTVENQTTDGSAVVVRSANLSDGGFLAVHENSTNATDDVLGASSHLSAGQHENVTVALDETLEADATVNVTAHRDTNENRTLDFAGTDGVEDGPYVNETGDIASDEAALTVEAPVEPGVEFVNCTAVRVNGTFDRLNVTLAHYTETGNDTLDRNLTDADVPGERPVDGTTLVTVGESNETTVTDDGVLVVRIADPGAFGDEAGSFVASANASASPTGDANLTATQPNAADCRAAVQPDAPTLGVENVTVRDDETALVNLSHENPNDAALRPNVSEFVNGTAAEEPTTTLAPGQQFTVVEWTPQLTSETLNWTVDLSNFDLPNESAETASAGEIAGLLEPPTETPVTTTVPDDTETESPTPTGTPNEAEARTPDGTDTLDGTETPNETETPDGTEETLETPDGTDTPTPNETDTPTSDETGPTGDTEPTGETDTLTESPTIDAPPPTTSTENGPTTEDETTTTDE